MPDVADYDYDPLSLHPVVHSHVFLHLSQFAPSHAVSTNTVETEVWLSPQPELTEGTILHVEARGT